MTDLIYRGFAHSGQQTPRSRVAQDLIYRGVRHDGLTAQAPAPTRSIAMRYRGVAYTLANGAARSDTATVTAAIDQIVPAHAFA